MFNAPWAAEELGIKGRDAEAHSTRRCARDRAVLLRRMIRSVTLYAPALVVTSATIRHP